MQQGRESWAHALRCDQVGDKGRDTEAERGSWEAVGRAWRIYKDRRGVP